MSFWSTTKIKEHEEIINPFLSKRVSQSSYELSLGEAFVTGNKKEENTNKRIEYNPSKPLDITIPAGQFALLLTDEVISIPTNAIGFISMKAKIKFQGLINVSGFHVDPGYSGKLMFSVFNAGTTNYKVRQGSPIFMLWLSDLDQTCTDPYSKAGKTSITTEDMMAVSGHPVSLPNMNVRLQQLESWVKVIGPLIGTIIAIIFFLLGQFFKTIPPKPEVTTQRLEVSGQPMINIQNHSTSNEKSAPTK